MAEIIYKDQDFKELINQAGKYVIVDFFATWCGPCKMLSPLLSEISEERDDVVVVKIDTDENMFLAQSFQVSSIPNVIIFKDGKPIDRFVGYHDKSQILAMLK